MREQFKKWLLNQGKVLGTTSGYAGHVDKVARHYAEKEGKDIGDIYQKIDDVQLISEIARQYRQNGKYGKEGYKHKGGWRAAFNSYEKFAIDRLLSGDKEPTDKIENKTDIEADVTPTNFQYEKDLQRAFCAQISSLLPDYKFPNEEYRIQKRRIDVLLQHKTCEELLVVELKAGRASESVFGQIAAYIGMLQQEPKFSDKKIRGLIVASEIDDGLRYACKTNPNISVKTYRMTLELEDSDMPESESAKSE